MRLTLVNMALVSWLGVSGLSEPLWSILDSLWFPAVQSEKAGANADPNGLTGAPPAGGTAGPGGLVPVSEEGSRVDPDG